MVPPSSSSSSRKLSTATPAPASSATPVPAAAAPNQHRAELLARLAKDVAALQRPSPAIKLEALKSASRTFQAVCQSLAQQQPAAKLLPELPPAEFDVPARALCHVLLAFRDLQRQHNTNTSSASSASSYRGYLDVELTDCAFHELVQQNVSGLNQATRGAHDLLPALRVLCDEEKHRTNARSQDIARRKKLGGRTATPSSNLTEQIRATLLPLLPTEDEQRQKHQVASEILAILEGNRAKPLRHDMFGSSASGLGFANADLDLALYTADFSAQELALVTESSLDGDSAAVEGAADRTELLRKLDKAGLVVLRCADLLRLSGQFDQIETVSSARVPVVRMLHRATQTQCDLAIGDHNELAVLNTRLMRCYGELDQRVKHFILLVKLWAKRRRVGDASEGFLSSYGWTLLALFYLQHKLYIPNLQLVQQQDEPNLVVDRKVNGFHVRFASQTTAASIKSETAASFDEDELLRGFFAYYSAEFKYKSEAVGFYPPTRGGGARKRGTDAPQWRFSIIDPFELTHDLGTTLSGRRAQVVINHELAAAHDYLAASEDAATPTLDGLFAGAPLLSNIGGRVCAACGETGHRSRACPNFEGSTAARHHHHHGGGGGGLNIHAQDRCFKCGQVGHISKNCQTKIKSTRLGGPLPAAASAPQQPVAVKAKLDLTKLAPAPAPAKTRLGPLPPAAVAAAAAAKSSKRPPKNNTTTTTTLPRVELIAKAAAAAAGVTSNTQRRALSTTAAAAHKQPAVEATAAVVVVKKPHHYHRRHARPDAAVAVAAQTTKN